MQFQKLISPKPINHHQQISLYITTIFILAGLWLLYAWYLSPPVFPLDDAYLILHNAQVLHQGHDINYPGVSALVGATSAIYLALVAALLYVVPPLWALEIINWLALFLYALGLLRLAFAFSVARWQAIAFFIIGLTLAYTPLQFFNGLETGLTLALLTWTLVMFTQPNVGVTRILRNILISLLPFLRPELAIFSFLLFLQQAWHYWQQQHSMQYWLRNVFIDGAIVILAVLPWVFWYWLSTGTPWPETINAKQAFFAQTHLALSIKLAKTIGYLFRFIITISIFSFMAMLFLLFFSPFAVISVIFMVLFCVIYTWYSPIALSFNVQRYLYVWIPLLLIGVLAGLRHHNNKIRIIATATLIYTVCQALIFFPVCWYDYLVARNYYATELPAVAAWCQQHMPAHATVLVHDAGYLAFATQLHLVDMVGLKSPENIQYHQQFTLPSNGAQRSLAIVAIINKTQPQYIIVSREWETLYGIIKNLQDVGWQIQLMRDSQNPLGNNYLIYKIVYAA